MIKTQQFDSAYSFMTKKVQIDWMITPIDKENYLQLTQNDLSHGDP